MVLPLLLSLGLPALAGTGALGATLAGFGVPALAGIGAGLGSFVQTGDLGKGIQTGLTSFLGGKILGGLSGSTSPAAINAGSQGAAATQPGFLQSALGPSPAASSIVGGPSSDLMTNFLGAEGANTALPFGSTTGATKGGALTAAQQGFMPGMIGQTMTDAQVAQKEYENRAAKKKEGDTTIPMPNPMRRTYNPNPYANGGGEGSYFNYQRPARFDGSEVQAPYTYAEGGYVDIQGNLGSRYRPDPNRQDDIGAAGGTSGAGKGAFNTARQKTHDDYYGNYAGGLPGGGLPYEELLARVSSGRTHQKDVAETRDQQRPFSPSDYYGLIERNAQPPMQGMGQGQPLQQYGQYLDNTYDNFDQKRNEFLSDVREQEMNTFDQSQQPQKNKFSGGLGNFSGIMGFKEGGEVEADQMMAQNDMNEKDVIVSAVEAIKGMSEQPEIVLALFVQKYGEEALRDLVGRVQSGELDDTVQRFEEGDKGMVRGPGDGSGVDDMVPATLEGEQDVLLSDGEFVLRKNTTDALEKAYGGGFLDVVNRAEEDAPKKLQQMVG